MSLEYALLGKIGLLIIIVIYIISYFLIEDILVDTILNTKISKKDKILDILLYSVIAGPMLVIRLINPIYKVFLVRVIKNVTAMKIVSYMNKNKCHDRSDELFTIMMRICANKYPSTGVLTIKELSKISDNSDDILDEVILKFEKSNMIKGYR